jgi:hypothetical protein
VVPPPDKLAVISSSTSACGFRACAVPWLPRDALRSIRSRWPVSGLSLSCLTGPSADSRVCAHSSRVKPCARLSFRTLPQQTPPDVTIAKHTPSIRRSRSRQFQGRLTSRQPSSPVVRFMSTMAIEGRQGGPFWSQRGACLTSRPSVACDLRRQLMTGAGAIRDSNEAASSLLERVSAAGPACR